MKLIGAPGNSLKYFHIASAASRIILMDAVFQPVLTGSGMVKSASTNFQNHHHAFLLTLDLIDPYLFGQPQVQCNIT